jgi:hypothetical protein
MNSDERTNQLVRELAALGLTMNADDERTKRLVRELAAEKEAQLEAAKPMLKLLVLIAAIVMFILCFWRYEIGLLLSIGAATLTIPAIGLAVALPIGYFLGKRAAWRFKMRIRERG